MSAELTMLPLAVCSVLFASAEISLLDQRSMLGIPSE